MIPSFLALLIRLLCGPTVRYVDAIGGTRPRVFFANHSSHLDFLVVWASLPADLRSTTRPVAAKDYWSGHVRRLFAVKLFNALLIERTRSTTGDNPVEQMLEALDRQYSLILFPEGTRGSGDEIASFRAGLYHIAQARPSVELVPVYLENLNRILPKGESLPVPLLSYVTFGQPLPSAELQTKQEFLEGARQALVGLQAAYA